MRIFVKWAGREYGAVLRYSVTIAVGVCIAVGLPWGMHHLSLIADSAAGFEMLGGGRIRAVAGAVVAVCGLALSGWTVLAQLGRGRGTPVPAMPTRTLLIEGPYRRCRNPMGLGIIGYAAGIGILLGSISALCIAGLFGAGLVAWIRLIEEKELAARFGRAYMDYRSRTPFIIPRLFRTGRRPPPADRE